MDLNVEVSGKYKRYLVFFKRSLSDINTYFFLLFTFQFRKFWSFLYCKCFVPTGEGSMRWVFSVIEPFYRLFPLKAPLPKYVETETTTLCNKKCVICEYVYWDKGDQEKRHLTGKEFVYMMDQLPKIRWSNVTGEGSSFLNPDYPGMLKYLSDRGASVWLVDHLDDIDFCFLEENVLPYIHGLYVSMDGATKETYEKIKKGCNFDKVIENLKAIVDYKRSNGFPLPHITFRYVVTRDNVDEIPAFLDLLDGIASPSEWGGSATKVEFTGLLSFPQISHLAVDRIPDDIIDKLKKRGKGIPFSFSHPEQSRNPPAHRCTAWLEPYLMLPGYVLPCCAVMMSNNRRWLRRCSFGNLFKDNFVDVWKGFKYSTFKRLLMTSDAPIPEICFGCRAFNTLDRARRYGVWSMQEDSKDLYGETGEVPVFYPGSDEIANLLDDVSWATPSFRYRVWEKFGYYVWKWKRIPGWLFEKFVYVVNKK